MLNYTYDIFYIILCMIYFILYLVYYEIIVFDAHTVHDT